MRFLSVFPRSLSLDNSFLFQLPTSSGSLLLRRSRFNSLAIALAKHAPSSITASLLYPCHSPTSKPNCTARNSAWKGSSPREFPCCPNYWKSRRSLDRLTSKGFDYFMFTEVLLSSSLHFVLSVDTVFFFPLVVTLSVLVNVKNRPLPPLYRLNYQSPYEHLPRGNLDS